MRSVSTVLLFWLLSACDVASVREAPSAIARNQCESDADCGGGTCVFKQCRSRNGTFQNLLFEVTPPANGSPIAGVQFLIPNKDLSEGDASLSLQQVSQVTGQVKAEMLKCPPQFGEPGNVLAKANDLSVPAVVSLLPAASWLGLYSPGAVVQAELIDTKYFSFSAKVTPGLYDIYVQPHRQPDESCPVPPLLLRGQEISSGPVSLSILLPEPSVFELHVAWTRGDGGLNGWTVDMLDSKTGRTISNRVPLALAKGSTTDYSATLAYNPVLALGKPSAQQADQWIRLSPPEDLPTNIALPTVIMARSALALFDANRGTLTDFTSLPPTVHLVGQVTSGSRPQPVLATVTLAASEINGMSDGVLASFTRTVNISADGHTFDVYLPPGKYRVSTAPQAPLYPSRDSDIPLAADLRNWVVPQMPTEQQGKVIELGNALPITGRVLNASGLPVSTAQVQASASPKALSESESLRALLDGPSFVPRASAGDVNSMGDFTLKADPGTFDISVRPNDDTGFAWLVLSRVPVTTANAGISLGQLTMPLPVSYGGTVTVGDTPEVVPGALVRAFIYLKDGQYTTNQDRDADSVLQVAETRADQDGHFDILIPAELNRIPE